MSKKMLEISNVKLRKKGKNNSETADIISSAVSYEYKYSMFALALGIIALLGGIVLIIHGAVGSISWSANILGFESHLNDAIPGVVLFIVGIFLTLITRPKVLIQDIED